MLYSVELRSLIKTLYFIKFCDSYRIQTCNLLIRSQMLYSVELRSLLLFAVAKVVKIFHICKQKDEKSWKNNFLKFFLQKFCGNENNAYLCIAIEKA